jgi:hypothetical protein
LVSCVLQDRSIGEEMLNVTESLLGDSIWNEDNRYFALFWNKSQRRKGQKENSKYAVRLVIGQGARSGYNHPLSLRILCPVPDRFAKALKARPARVLWALFWLLLVSSLSTTSTSTSFVGVCVRNNNGSSFSQGDYRRIVPNSSLMYGRP